MEVLNFVYVQYCVNIFSKQKGVFISWNVTWVCIFPLYAMLPVFFHMTLHANYEERKSSLTDDYFDMSTRVQTLSAHLFFFFLPHMYI